MKKLWLIMGCIIVISAFAAGYATMQQTVQREKETPSTSNQEIPSVIDHSMAIDVDEETYEPIGITRSFSINDEKVVSWIKFGPVYRSHEVLWEWYSPDNKLYFTRSEMMEDPGEGYFWEEYISLDYRLTPYWEIGYEVSQILGEWRVDIYLDGTWVLTESFTISSKEKCKHCTYKFEIFSDDCKRVGIDKYHCKRGKWKWDKSFGVPKFKKRDELPKKCIWCKHAIVAEQTLLECVYTLYHCDGMKWVRIAKKEVPKEPELPKLPCKDCQYIIVVEDSSHILYHCKNGKWVKKGSWVEKEVPNEKVSLIDGCTADFFDWGTGAEVSGPDWCDIETVSFEQIEEDFVLKLTLCEDPPEDARFEIEIALDTDLDSTTGVSRPPEDERSPFTAYNDIGADYIIWTSFYGNIVEETGVDVFTGVGDFPWDTVSQPTSAVVSGNEVYIRFSEADIERPQAFTFVVFSLWVTADGEWIVDVTPDEGHCTWIGKMPARVEVWPIGPVDNQTGNTHTVIATVKDANGNPMPGVYVEFVISAGLNPQRAVVKTDKNGNASFTYRGKNKPFKDTDTDTDIICVYINGRYYNEASKRWYDE